MIIAKFEKKTIPRGILKARKGLKLALTSEPYKNDMSPPKNNSIESINPPLSPLNLQKYAIQNNTSPYNTKLYNILP
jgi:hypothetical protein